MIVDCYTHVWEAGTRLGRHGPAGNRSKTGGGSSTATLEAGTARHLAASQPVDATIVVGFKSRYLDAEILNQQIAAYASSHPGRVIAFAGIDPSDPKEALADLHRAKQEHAMPGIAVAPAAQDCHPCDSRAMRVYAEAASLGMPVLFHTGPSIQPQTKLEYARPVLLDEIAREFPTLKIIVAHMGFPWVDETIALLAKHANVFAEISWLLHHPWSAYQSLINAHQFEVMDHLLFGSGFPFASAADCIEALYGINHFAHGTNLPAIPREMLRGIVERDALGLLGIADNRRKEPARELARSDEDESDDL